MTTSTPHPTAGNAAVLWTGGKDSALALHEARRHGWRVNALVTFAPPEPAFRAHPIAVMKLQAQALGLPHWVWPVSAPFAAGYEAGLRWLRATQQMDTVITGDLAEAGGAPNWIRERARPVGMNVLTPLWQRDRLTLLRQLLAAGFQVFFSCVNTRWLAPEWVGRPLDENAMAELRELHARTGLDPCGEQGEYHTLVTDAPDFQRRVRLDAGEIRTRNGLAYWRMIRAELAAKS